MPTRSRILGLVSNIDWSSCGAVWAGGTDRTFQSGVCMLWTWQATKHHFATGNQRHPVAKFVKQCRNVTEWGL